MWRNSNILDICIFDVGPIYRSFVSNVRVRELAYLKKLLLFRPLKLVLSTVLPSDRAGWINFMQIVPTYIIEKNIRLLSLTIDNGQFFKLLTLKMALFSDAFKTCANEAWTRYQLIKSMPLKGLKHQNQVHIYSISR